MKSLGSTGRFLWALFLVLFAFICSGNSFKQELWFYDAQDNAIQFRSQVGEMSDFTSFLPKVTRACARGYWYLFSEANFLWPSTHQGTLDSSSIMCSNFTTASSVKSLRYFGADDTDTDALSLYEGEGFYWSGTEVFVTARAHTGITNKIISIAATGTSDWTLFEGQELDGKSICYQVPQSGYSFSLNYLSELNLATIGSVFKGCEAQEIQNYKTLHSFVNSY